MLVLSLVEHKPTKQFEQRRGEGKEGAKEDKKRGLEEEEEKEEEEEEEYRGTEGIEERTGTT